jgi:uncharacterized membrane protein YgdD (TMEM256/DUF423 family)
MSGFLRQRRPTRFPARPYNAQMEKFTFIAGAISAFIGVAAGAFGAHALKSRISPDLLAVFEVGVRYQMYHAFALIATAWVLGRWPGSAASAAGMLFVVGTLLFSGSLYLLSLSGIRWLGAITPLGGLAWLAAWACLVWAVAKG